MTAPLNSKRGEARVQKGIARAEVAQTTANRAVAEQWAAIGDVLEEARCNPSAFVDRRVDLSASQRVDYAQRAAAADIAVRLGLSETTVRSQAADAATLRHLLPRVWAIFRAGEMGPPNARCAAELTRSLPEDPQLADAFDAALSQIAGLAPARFRARARVLRERIHSVALADRARAAEETRGVWLDGDVDGMAFLSMKLPIDVAHQAFARVDAAARALAGDDEARPLSQLRADVAGDLLMHGELAGDYTLPAVRVAVAVTVPVMTLLAQGDEPGTLEGHGPIDADTARRLAAGAPSFTRLLTHPVSGALLDIDRTTYRVPADLKRWLELTDVTCRFPGCGRLARNSDIDHTLDFQYGGTTRADNLAHLCRHHHRLKHLTRWRVRPAPERPEQRVMWTSPTGHERAADPPPF